MIAKSAMVTAAQGSLGGLTFQTGHAGMTVKARTIPTNPASMRQRLQRQSFSNIRELWHTLSTAERDSWDTYAASLPAGSPKGKLTKTSGFHEFMRSNMPRQRNFPDRPLIRTAPPAGGRCSPPKIEPLELCCKSDGMLWFTFNLSVADPPPDWNDDDRFIITCSRLVPVNTRSCRIPHRYRNGDLIPPAGEQPCEFVKEFGWIDSEWPHDEGPFLPPSIIRRVFFSCFCSRADGRISNNFEFSLVTEPAP